ncbi:hypothetical protein [Ruficoccus sp. ZRK36]|uniref:hypothetical protein n=1 Tax=Ruficoccus sp. ZRK36 TaxID=2866311 RepID=UPI001C72C54E|nr:hypothetical protein [Ruficoccus sp. ZRK36]QYY37138.1 hypothetical protein K0V07_06560 [Ruficoccus sp. ZRK36]
MTPLACFIKMSNLTKIIILCALLLVCCLLGVFIFFESTLGQGKVYSFDSEKDIYELRRYAYLAYPAIVALNNYHQNNGEYPMSLDDTDLSPEYISNVFSFSDLGEGFFYYHYRVADDQQQFEIYMKTTMGHTLWYWGDSGRWTYNFEDTELELQI